MVEELTTYNFEDEVVYSNIPVIVDFYADWCAPCQMMKPIFEEVSEEYSGKLKFMKLDTQEEQGLTVRFGIQGIPALVLVHNSKEIGRIIGYMDKDSLKREINKILNKK